MLGKRERGKEKRNGKGRGMEKREGRGRYDLDEGRGC